MGKPKGLAGNMIEGTWEEIKQHDQELSGRRFRLVPLPEKGTVGKETPLSLEEEERLLDELAARNEHVPVLPPEANSREWLYEDHD